MSCKHCPSSVKSFSNVEKKFLYNVTAHNTCNYSITVDGHTNTFSISASASASSNIHSIAAENATRLAKKLTNIMAQNHINTFTITSGKKNIRSSKSLTSNNHNYKDITTYSVNSNDPQASPDAPMATSKCRGYGCQNNGKTSCCCSLSPTDKCTECCCTQSSGTMPCGAGVGL